MPPIVDGCISSWIPDYAAAMVEHGLVEEFGVRHFDDLALRLFFFDDIELLLGLFNHFIVNLKI